MSNSPNLYPTCGTVAPTTEAVLDAVRESNGRRPVRPAETVEAAEAEVRDFLVVPEWYAGETAADVAADSSDSDVLDDDGGSADEEASAAAASDGANSVAAAKVAGGPQGRRAAAAQGE